MGAQSKHGALGQLLQSLKPNRAAHASSASAGAQKNVNSSPGTHGSSIAKPAAHAPKAFGKAISIEGDDAFQSKVMARLEAIKSTKSGQETLRQIEESGHNVRIVEYKGNNSFSGPLNWQNATAKGTPVYNGAGKPIKTGNVQQVGTGIGSDTLVQLNPDLVLPIYDAEGSSCTFMPNDAVLFHELTHSAHQTNGNMDCTPLPGWDTAEEKRTISTGSPNEAQYMAERGFPYHRTDHDGTFVRN